MRRAERSCYFPKKPTTTTIGPSAADDGIVDHVLAQRQLLGEQDVDRLESGERTLFEATHDMVERLEGARHLEADEVVPNAVDGGCRA